MNSKMSTEFSSEQKHNYNINERVISVLLIRINISQKSSISLILYLFYNADLLNICEKLEIKINDLNFVNDVNILIYSISTKKNCRTLEVMHKKCEL